MSLRKEPLSRSVYADFILLLVMAALVLLAGCVASPVGSTTNPSSSQIAGEESSADVQLAWQGDVAVGGEAERCHRLIIVANDQAEFGPCDERTRAATLEAAQWDEIANRFAPFSYEEGRVTVTFNGQGDVTGEAWQKAIANWAKTKYAELYSGNACAACQTVMHWSFGEVVGQPGRCASLTVTNHGYAYKNISPCGGSESEILAEGWLTTEELARLQEWVETRETIYFGENNSSYLNGQGSQAMTPAELSELTEWAEHVQDRLDD